MRHEARGTRHARHDARGAWHEARGTRRAARGMRGTRRAARGMRGTRRAAQGARHEAREVRGRARTCMRQRTPRTTLYLIGPISVLYRLYLGIADGTSIARVWACRYSKRPPRSRYRADIGPMRYRQGTHLHEAAYSAQSAGRDEIRLCTTCVETSSETPLLTCY